ncbi:MAG: DUF1624 domain-containing protein [Ruminococcaceae bacterium]|nr:DUF1624 domain-containing protein [Oscillospiraceae bacterium]
MIKPTKSDAGAATRRIHIIDILRAVAIIYMVFYHVLFDLAFVWRYDWAIQLYDSQRYIVIFDELIFVVLSGVCANLSKSNAERGAGLLCIALGFTAVTAFVFPGGAIYFGVLHMLSCSMLIYAAVGKWLKKIPWWVGAPLFAAAALLTWNVKRGYFGIGDFSFAVPDILVYNNNLYPFGFINASYAAADYFPLMPWLFVFLAGAYVGSLCRKELPKPFYKNYCPPLAFIGRHSLLIYVIHQPIIFAILYIIKPL